MTTTTARTVSTEPPAPAPGDKPVHPLFERFASSADVFILSQDDELFPMSSSTLRRTSGWFNSMFTLPQGPAPAHTLPSASYPLSVAETSDVLAGLFSLINGTGVPSLKDLDLLEKILFAADKYEMPMPIALVRAALPLHIQQSPVRAYAIASIMSWEDELNAAVVATFSINVLSPENLQELTHVESRHLYKLLDLHERRKHCIADMLEGGWGYQGFHCLPITTARRCEAAPPGGPPCDQLLDPSPWWSFKLGWVREPWKFVGLCEEHIAESAIPGLQAALDSQQCPACHYTAYPKSALLDELRCIARSAPDSITDEPGSPSTSWGRCTAHRRYLEDGPPDPIEL